MTTFIALLRGINVGGKNKIKMADLKSMFEAIGMSRVKTYIQSGNVLFESDEEEEDTLRQKLEKEIEVTFGFSIKVILRTSQELKKVAENCPFSQDEIAAAEATAEGESLYVSFLLQEPSEEGIKRIEAYKSETEEYKIVDRDMYLLFPQSILKSKLANNLQKLDVPVTVRNWKTVNKLVSLVNEMED
jgi:uncharacterized protein (DUF1697 family)